MVVTRQQVTGVLSSLLDNLRLLSLNSLAGKHLNPRNNSATNATHDAAPRWMRKALVSLRD
jgi:hypothetical protein